MLHSASSTTASMMKDDEARVEIAPRALPLLGTQALLLLAVLVLLHATLCEGQSRFWHA